MATRESIEEVLRAALRGTDSKKAAVERIEQEMKTRHLIFLGPLVIFAAGYRSALVQMMEIRDVEVELYLPLELVCPGCRERNVLQLGYCPGCGAY